MEFPHDDHDNIIQTDFAGHREQIGFEKSPFGPIQKYGKEIIEKAQKVKADRDQPTTGTTYRPFHDSRLSYAIERTDTSDPNEPFQDF